MISGDTLSVQIFTKLCQIASGTESDQVKKNRKKVDAIKVRQKGNGFFAEFGFL